MEVCDGIKDHCVRDPGDPADTRWEYTYHQRLFAYTVPSVAEPIDQIEDICQQLAKTGYTRRAQAVTWKVWEDRHCYDPACLQSLWCRLTEDAGGGRAEHERPLSQQRCVQSGLHEHVCAGPVAEPHRRAGGRIVGRQEIRLGRYCHMADSYHIYGSNMAEFKSRFLGAQSQPHLRGPHDAVRGRERLDGAGSSGDSGQGSKHGTGRMRDEG